MICLSWKALWNLSLTFVEVNNCNREDPFVFRYKCSTNRMLSISFNYTQRLSAGSPASHIISIKIKYLCLAPRKHPDQAQLSMTAGRELIHPPSEVDGNQEGFDFTLSPFSVKQAWILTQPRWFLGIWVHHYFDLPAFQTKSLFLAPTTHLLIYWPVLQEAIWLGNTMTLPTPKRGWVSAHWLVLLYGSQFARALFLADEAKSMPVANLHSSLYSGVCRGGGQKLYPSSFIWLVKNQHETDKQEKSKQKVNNMYTSVHMGESQKTWVTHQNGWNPHLKCHLQLETKEDVVGSGLGLECGGRWFMWRWKSKCLELCKYL